VRPAERTQNTERKIKNRLLIVPALLTIQLWPVSNGQNLPSSFAEDPFIGVIDSMKRSVAPLVCLSVKGEESTILSREASAFFVTPAGDFLTAAHVLEEMRKSGHPCPVSAITLPKHGWQPGTLNEPAIWFPFSIDACKVAKVLDVAECHPTTDLSRSKADFRVVPVQFEWNIPPDGTQVAFTGFPFGVRDPMTFRAGMAAYSPVWRGEKVIDEVVLDRSAWPGFSGSPVFVSSGRVIGIQ
jgi:hypothetical protein